jgi:hypothetical protein
MILVWVAPMHGLSPRRCPDARVHRAGAERFWTLCAPSAAKLESVGVVMTVITAMTAMKATAKIRQTGTGE